MIRNATQSLRALLLTSLLFGASLTFLNCSGEKKETNSATSETAGTDETADSSFMGRQGDTINSSSMDAPQQAPPDSASNRQRATVPAEIKVKAKRE